MDIAPVDLGQLIPATLGVLVALVPVIGLTIRFAIKPVVEALVHVRQPPGGGPQMEQFAVRLRELEDEVIRLKNLDPYRVGLPASTDALGAGQGRG